MAQNVLRFVCILLGLAGGSRVGFAASGSVSYTHEIAPIFRRSCNGCHYPGKLKGELDLTTYPAVLKGGKHGAAIKPRHPKEGTLMEEISGAEPSMPKEGDPLTPKEAALIERWIRQGAPDDTPKIAPSLTPRQPPKYTSLPVVSALACSVDGGWLAVSGFHEVLLYRTETWELAARLLGESARIENLAFSPDGRLLAVAGNAPGLFGQVQIWELVSNKLQRAFKISNESIYGLGWSPQSDRVAVGSADRISRVFNTASGKELAKFENHSDWVLGTAFTLDGKRYISASRDKCMKLVDAATGQYVDDLNKQTEPIVCLARHPLEDIAAFGTDQGMIRTYKIAENSNRSAEGKDPNFIKELERVSGAVNAIAFSPDGNFLAAAGLSEVKIFGTKEWKKVATLKGSEGPVFAVAFPRTNVMVAGGFDGKLRVYELPKGSLVKTFNAVPLGSGEQTASR